MANARRLSSISTTRTTRRQQLEPNALDGTLDSTRPPHHTRPRCAPAASSATATATRRRRESCCESHLPDRPLARLSRSAHTPALPAAPVRPVHRESEPLRQRGRPIRPACPPPLVGQACEGEGATCSCVKIILDALARLLHSKKAPTIALIGHRNSSRHSTSLAPNPPPRAIIHHQHP